MGLFSKKTKKEDKKGKVDQDRVSSSMHSKTDSKVKSVSKKETKKQIKKEPIKKDIKKSGEAHRFLLRPIISEKATVGASDGKYTFEVSNNANKVAIKKAIKEVYGVVPQAVNIMNKSGKSVRFGRNLGRTKHIKKAIVTLRKGDSIKLYEGI